jgi:hypothetical protein
MLHILWKYKELKIKMPCQKFVEFYYCSILVPRWTAIWMNECTHCIYGFGQPYLTLLASCTRITYDNYNTTRINETLINNVFQLFYYYHIGFSCNYPTISYNNNNNYYYYYRLGYHNLA